MQKHMSDLMSTKAGTSAIALSPTRSAQVRLSSTLTRGTVVVTGNVVGRIAVVNITDNHARRCCGPHLDADDGELTCGAVFVVFRHRPSATTDDIPQLKPDIDRALRVEYGPDCRKAKLTV